MFVRVCVHVRVLNQWFSTSSPRAPMELYTTTQLHKAMEKRKSINSRLNFTK